MAAISSHKRWSELSQPEKLSRWLAHQRYVRNAERRYTGAHWLETITAARFEGNDKMGDPKWVYRLKYLGWGPRWNRWEEADAMLVDDSQTDGSGPQIVDAFWGSLSKEDRRRASLIKVKGIIRPAQKFIEERQRILQSFLQSPEYQEYRDGHGHVESDTEMSDLEVDEPQLFNILKKAKGKRPKRYKGRVPARKAHSASKVKKLKLRVHQQPAAVLPTASDTADDQRRQDQHFATQLSFHSGVFQGASRPSLRSNGPNLNLSSSASELVQASNHQPVMFQVNIPARGYHITPSQNPKRRTIFEEPLYTDDGDFPMVNRTYELVRKNVVAPTWSELPFEDDLTHHDQQLPTDAEGSVDSEMAVVNDLKDDPDDPIDDEQSDMDMNVDSTHDPSSGSNPVPRTSSVPARTVLEPNQIEVSVLGAARSVASVVMSLLDLVICDDFGGLIQCIKQYPDLCLEGPYDNAQLGLEGWQVQDAVIGIEVSDSGGFQDALLGVASPKFYRLCSGSNATNYILFNPARPPTWLMVPEEAQECQLVLWKL